MSGRRVDAGWVAAGVSEIFLAIEAGEFQIARDLLRYVVARRAEDREARRLAELAEAVERRDNFDGWDAGLCAARGCFRPVVHRAARGCAEHWPRFDRVRKRRERNAELEHAAWSRAEVSEGAAALDAGDVLQISNAVRAFERRRKLPNRKWTSGTVPGAACPLCSCPIAERPISGVRFCTSNTCDFREHLEEGER